ASSALASLNASSALSGASLFSLAGLGELSSYDFSSFSGLWRIAGGRKQLLLS
ncbi:hypothetical protein RCH06_002921, partial [Polaromonas sp. CG_9.5]|nr:hypothetical protein [Polaromonas sp. CG_9.5]